MPQIGCTAATVQQMVLGNADARSCTGVVLTRHPATGERELYGEYLLQAHGEDLVSGRQTPLPLLESAASPGQSLEETMPAIVTQLRQIGRVLEERFGVAQDIEFTVERGNLYILQARSVRAAAKGAPTSGSPEPPPLPLGPLGARAMPDGGTATPRYRIIARGLGASPGGVVGRIALTAEAVRRMAAAGDKTVFLRPTTTPEDLAGMVAASGVLTQRGGVTSHAANNARYLAKPCVVGCLALAIEEKQGTVTIGETALHEGDLLFMDGMTGEVGIPI